ncbi:MAG: Tat pathway signal sequence domain protein [Phycisphaerae bacterium]|nr:Tat pathway signal sequence domain protein [Phycisphaerae bacterium]
MSGPARSCLLSTGVPWIAMLGACLPAAGQAPLVQLNWLDGRPPAVRQGVSWGVPWPKGGVQKGASLVLRTADGQAVPMQTWPLAYWPDGSIQWSGHSMVGGPQTAGPLTIAPGTAAAASVRLAVADGGGTLDVDTGSLKAHILKQGENLFESLWIGDRQVAANGKLIARLEDRSMYESSGVVRERTLVSRVTRVSLEQAGPIRAVVKLEGEHASPDRALLPFVVRLTFYAGSESIRLVHSFVYDGESHKDFIRGLGLSFSVPFQEELHNRHVRFVGDAAEGGVWVQPVRLLPGYRSFPRDLYDLHLGGKRMQDYGGSLPGAVASVPVWNDFRLVQLGPDSFSIDKRTQDQSAWLHVNHGRRSLGMAVLGDVSGGLAVGVKDFWQKCPASIEIRRAASDVGEMRVWLWSPEGEAMDLRHYDVQGHGLETNYEDWKPGWDNAYGVARTADLLLWAFSQIPSNESLLDGAQGAAQPPLLVCTPQYYHEVAAFGTWSLPDRSSPAKKWLEDQVEQLCGYYRAQVEERRWYGFWDYGDIMHHYDFGRHEWRYDVGGWAWNNSELAPDIFLYFMFLRTGRPEIFRMAEAMTRHTSEVDVHHIGVFAPLGSRHNVRHWGDGAKQPRISQSTFKRFYYYLTTDDRAGDLMREQLDADLAYRRVREMDTGRVPVGVVAGNQTTPWTGEDMAARGLGGARAARGAAQARAAAAETSPQFYSDGRPMESRYSDVQFGLDWICYAMNWTTEWERTGDPVWRDRVLAGMRTIVARRGSGPGPGRYFDVIFGGAEAMAQMQPMYDAPEFWAYWAEACRQMASSSGSNMTAPRMAAYAASVTKDAALGRRAWDALIGDADVFAPIAQPQRIAGPDVLHPRHDPVFLGGSAGWQLHGPASIQWALNALEALELAKDYLPEWEASRTRTPRQGP